MPNLLCCGSAKLKSSGKRRPSAAPSSFFDAVSHLAAALYPEDLQLAVDKSLRAIISSCENIRVFLHPQVVSRGSASLINEANFQLQSRVTIEEVSPSNGEVSAGSKLTHQSLLESFFSGDELGSQRHGIICPVRSSTCSNSQALIAFVAKPLSAEEKGYLDELVKQVGITLDRVKRLVAKATPEPTSPILELCSELFDHDSILLQKKLLRYLKKRTGAQAAFIALSTDDFEELYCQVVDDRVLEPVVRLASDPGIIQDCMSRKQPVLIGEDASKAYLADVHRIVGSETDITSCACVPILSKSADRVIHVACLMNKGHEGFSKADVDMVEECFRFAFNTLSSALSLENERTIKKQTQKMLQVAMNIFRKLDNLSILLREIMQEARNLTSAERCSVFLLEKETNELVAKVFDGLPTSREQTEVNRGLRLDDGSVIEQAREIRIPSTQGVAGHVATTGEILNIVDAYAHHLFYRGVDEETGFRTRNILCFPIKNERGEVVGVAQLCNKSNGHHFTSTDEELARTFSVYCGISLVHSLMYKKVEDSQMRSRLANELMSYHMKVTDERVAWLWKLDIPPVQDILPDFMDFACVPRVLEEDTSLKAVLSMFEDMNLITRWRMSRNTLARFVLMVKHGYRDPAYHNWVHAFTVAHFVYLCIHNLPLENHLDPLELVALFVASLCHDIDHRGTNNSFQVDSQSTIAALYSSEGSVLERHHFSQTVCILNSEGCNIFENLTRQEYQRVLDLVRDIILATDLAHHLRIIKDLRAMVDGKYNASDPQHHDLLLCLLMTSADLSDQTKNWKNTRKVAQLIYNEFFQQGDLEKALGKNPEERFDREKACVPDQQIFFLDSIALPLYQLMCDLYPECICLTDAIRRNRSNWEQISVLVREGKVSGSGKEIYEAPLVPDDKEEENGPINAEPAPN